MFLLLSKAKILIPPISYNQFINDRIDIKDKQNIISYITFFNQLFFDYFWSNNDKQQIQTNKNKDNKNVTAKTLARACPI